MRQLILYAQSHAQSFGQQIKGLIVERLTAQGHHVQLRDLYALGFVAADHHPPGQDLLAPDPIVEQHYIRWAEQLFFVFPLRKGSLPVVLQQYLLRVCATLPAGALQSRRAVIITTREQLPTQPTAFQPASFPTSAVDTWPAMQQQLHRCGVTISGRHDFAALLARNPKGRSQLTEVVKQLASAV